MQTRFIFMLLLMALASVSLAQSKKKQKHEETGQPQPSSLDPTYPEREYKQPKKRSKKSSIQGPTYESDKEYAERMQATAKAKTKNERMLEKPQYSDPMYFGHKRPPKKHRPNKMKFCKVCGIRH